MLMQMYQHTLFLIYGKSVTFLDDSDAAHSVIKADTLSTPPKMSRRYGKSMWASGDTVLGKYTSPLSCGDNVAGKFKCLFWLLNC